MHGGTANAFSAGRRLDEGALQRQQHARARARAMAAWRRPSSVCFFLPRLRLPLPYDLQPRERRVLVLVCPVRGGAVLGDVVHLEGTYLHLERLRTDEHRRVE
eukprot:603196-Pleurochrysis_carterae.AAC.2